MTRTLTPAERFGENVRLMREEFGQSQSALALELQDLGLSFNQLTVSRIELGTRKLTLDEAIIIAGYFKRGVEFLALHQHTTQPGIPGKAQEVIAA